MLGTELTPAFKTEEEYRAGLEQLEARLLQEPQPVCPLTHRFAPGVYLREIFMPAGCIIEGHEHRTEHFNIVLQGRVRVMMNGQIEDIVAPAVFVSKPGVRKVLHILEDCRWATVHPTDETDIAKIEEMMIVKSQTWLEHHKQLQAHDES